MFRLILETGDALPTKVFGNYESLDEAERAKNNVEKTTHYKGRIEPLEPEDLELMFLNATKVTPESESYPDLPNQKRMPFPDGFPMPPAQSAAPPPPPQPEEQPAEQPTATEADILGNSPLGDPYLAERDAVAMEQQGVNSESIKSAYRWMGAKTLNGTAEGNGHWQPCEGGDYNRITGHWREPDGQGGYNLYTIFEIAVRMNLMPSVHDARLKLFDEDARRQYKSDKAQEAAEAEVGKVGESEPAKPETKPAPPPVDTMAQSEALGRRLKELEEQDRQAQDTLAPTEIFLTEIRMARERLVEAVHRMKTAETQYDFCFTICELDAAIDEMCMTIDLELEQAERRKAKLTQTSPKAGEPTQTLPESKEPLESTKAEANGQFSLEETTTEEMGIAKGTCRKLRESNISTYGDLMEKIGDEQDWDILTDLPGIGIAKVDSIKGACEKLMEKQNHPA